jgi:lipid-A-disaccharide synthase
LAHDFWQVAFEIHRLKPEVQLVAGMLDQTKLDQMISYQANKVPVKFFIQKTPVVFSASDVALVTSGTATLECLFHKVPHVVIYRTSWFNFQIGKRLIKTPYIGMSNIVSQHLVASEYVQDQINPSLIAQELISLLEQGRSAEKKQSFYKTHQSFLMDSDQKAAEIVRQLREGNANRGR